MDFLYEWSIWKLMLIAWLWTPPLVLVHELGHAFTALELTSGRVLARVGLGPALRVGLGRLELELAVIGPGLCEYEPGTLRGPARSQAWIAAAGPLTSLIAALGLGLLAGMADDTLEGILAAGAVQSGFGALFTALPLRYGRGIGVRGESDGMAVWRILTGGPPRRGREPRDRRVAGPVYLLLLGVVGILAFLVSPSLGLGLIALVGVAFLFQATDSG